MEEEDATDATSAAATADDVGGGNGGSGDGERNGLGMTTLAPPAPPVAADADR